MFKKYSNEIICLVILVVFMIIQLTIISFHEVNNCYTEMSGTIGNNYGQ